MRVPFPTIDPGGSLSNWPGSISPNGGVGKTPEPDIKACECARFTELAPGTTWITALIIARQRREEKDQR
jgi:hypothetical protein